MNATSQSASTPSTAPVPTRADVGRLLGWHRMPLSFVIVTAVIAALVPFVTSNAYYINLLILIFIYAVLNQAWNLTLGMTGAWNFGQLALFAAGGYAAGISEAHLGVSPWLGILIGALAASAINVVLALPSMRLRGIYVALLTFSFAEVIRLLIINDTTGLTGGVFGLTNIMGPFQGMSPLASHRAFYLLTLATCIITALIIQRVMHSPYGVAFQAIRDSSRYASGLGVSMRFYYVAATTLSAFLSGVAGALYAYQYSTISPSVMGLTPMSLLVLMIIVGGLGTLSGPIIGTAVVMILTELLRGAGEWRLLVLGIALLAIIMLRPAGVVRVISPLVHGFREWMNADQRPSEQARQASEPPGEAAAMRADGAAGDARAPQAAGSTPVSAAEEPIPHED